jgi:hypothetical protein
MQQPAAQDLSTGTIRVTLASALEMDILLAAAPLQALEG